MTCKSTSAGAVQLENHGIESWSVIQQVVSFNSDESESYAIEASKVDRWETLDHRRKQNRRIGAYPETCAEDVAERAIEAVEKVPDKIDSLNKEAKCTGKSKEKLLGARSALEPSMQRAATVHEWRKLAEEAIAVAEFAFASPREPYHWVLERGGDAKPREHVQSCRCEQSICCILERTSTAEFWLHLWTGTNSQCE